ncbi:MAG: hypothetical protein IJI14_08305 [Anaerolineaceae bacterium]|nr:hypothetical protein [Anaerolineaceae bacterium]
MSETYYLVNKTKNLEYDKFKAFWEEKLLPHFDEMIEQYAAERSAENPAAEEFVRDMCNLRYSSTIRDARYFPVYDTVYKQRLGYYSDTTHRFVWDEGGDATVSGTAITSKETLKKVLDTNPDISLCDDYGRLMSLDKFLSETRL